MNSFTPSRAGNRRRKHAKRLFFENDFGGTVGARAEYQVEDEKPSFTASRVYRPCCYG